MPEILEVEMYRRLAEQTVGRRITEALVPDAWFCRPHEPAEIVAAVTGQRIVAARRRGKLLLIDVTGGVCLGMRFGMTGRLILDGRAAIDKLEYSSHRNDPAWDRFGLRFGRRGMLHINDPRRLGGVQLDPDEAILGPDALTITQQELTATLARSLAPVKACLLDQHRVAGIGNLLADEVLWRAGIDPARPASSLDGAQLTALHDSLTTTLPELLERGGSHTGDLMADRSRSGRCPIDGAELDRRTIGGRTTYSCPVHQR
ncbi:MAG: Fpg/Nei family DNA glycosylase [Acidimicrobiia bacterium]